MKKTVFMIMAAASALAWAALNSGCVITYVKTPYGTGLRGALAYPFKLGPVNIVTTNASVSAGGYETDGGQSILGTVVESAVKGGIKGAKGAQ